MLRRLGVTLAGLVAYLAACWVALPFLNPEAVSEISGDGVSVTRASLVALGIMPFVTGFIIVEIVSFLTAAGRRLRHAGSTASGRYAASRRSESSP